jgi:Pyruvate/2-oxoacid:ferredoxin oxidoreductase delta subunit
MNVDGGEDITFSSQSLSLDPKESPRVCHVCTSKNPIHPVPVIKNVYLSYAHEVFVLCVQKHLKCPIAPHRLRLRYTNMPPKIRSSPRPSTKSKSGNFFYQSITFLFSTCTECFACPRSCPKMLARSAQNSNFRVLLLIVPDHSSTRLSNIWMLKIITSNPIVTAKRSTKPIQPSVMAAVPTPLITLPLPRSCAIVLAATEAVCCHSTLTSTNIEATKMSARATWETGRDGKGLTSRSEPRSSVSSCQPGKLARRQKTTKAKMSATILVDGQCSALGGRA